MAEDTGIVTVSGLTNGQEAQLTVSTTRDGSLPGQSATTGFALRTARTPDLGTVQRRDGAIRVPITNFDADWEWTAEATDGDAALITVEGVHLVEVTNLTDGEETTITVTSTRDGWFDGTNTTTGAALDTELVPVLVDDAGGPVVHRPDRQLRRRRLRPRRLHLGRVGHGRVGELERRHRCGHRVRTDQRSRSPPDRDHHPHRLPRRQRRHRRPRPAHRPHPDMGSVTRLPGGFTAPIRNYDPAFGGAPPPPSAPPTSSKSSTARTRCTYCRSPVWSQRTVRRHRHHHPSRVVPGSTPVSGRSELAQLDPILGEVVRAPKASSPH